MAQNSLSEAEVQALMSFREKFGTFPGSSDAETVNIARIVTSKNLSVQDIQAYLGDPSRKRKTSGAGLKGFIIWYDVGDSRTIGFEFDENGTIIDAHGLGVGFRTMIHGGDTLPKR